MTAIPPAVTPTSPAVDTCAAPESARVQAIAEEAYIYGFPLLAAYKAMYQFNIDRASSQYKAGFNDLVSEARLFTPEDTAIVTPNSDTPYSMVQLDLRAEPMVLRVPTVEPHRYYSIQLVTQSTFNFGYIGTRATGSEAGCYMVTGPGWNGETPKGIVKTFASETHFALAVYRTQLFDADDLDNVRKVQSGYTAMPLSSFLKQAPASAAPAIDFPEFTPDCIKGGSLALLNFLLQFSPESPEESEMRARFAEIGVVSARPFALEKLPPETRAAVTAGIQSGYGRIQKKIQEIGTSVNGWRVADAFGDRAFHKGDWLRRAAAAAIGLYGNDAVEALYPIALTDAAGEQLDGHGHRYTMTFAADALPPVHAFWSVTIYDARNQMLVANPLDRYLINSSMLPSLTRNADGSVTVHVQKDKPSAETEANWLPAPDGPFSLVMRLYLPRAEALDGRWKPAPVVRTD